MTLGSKVPVRSSGPYLQGQTDFVLSYRQLPPRDEARFLKKLQTPTTFGAPIRLYRRHTSHHQVVDRGPVFDAQPAADSELLLRIASNARRRMPKVINLGNQRARGTARAAGFWSEKAVHQLMIDRA